MTRIRVLEAIAGADFSWAPGDLIDLPDEQASGWADGHRAELVDDGQEQDAGRTPSMVHQQPVVVGEDGQELEVLTATLEEIAPPAGVEDGPQWVQWSVTVRLPAPGTPAAPADPAPSDQGAIPGADGGDQVPALEPGAQPLFNPTEHTNREVLAYLEDASYEEALRVFEQEATEGEDRAGIRNQRDTVLSAARAREAAASGSQQGAEKAADTSRGGGRGEQPETRSW